MIRLLATFLCLLPLASFASKTAEKIYAQYSPGIVAIESVYGTGTGFFVSEEIILTNRHVVFGLEKERKVWNAPRKFTLSSGREISAYEFMVCSKRLDICAIRIDGGKGAPKIAFSTREIIPGEDAFVIGHPKKMKVPVLTSGVISSKVSTLNSVDYEHKPMVYEGFTTSASISFGSSGSPVISKNGELLGVITSFIKGSQNLNIAVSAVELNKFVADLNEQKLDDYIVVDQGFEKGFDEILAGKEKTVVPVAAVSAPDADHARKKLTTYLPHVKRCYQAELDRSGVKYSGEINLKFTVSTMGSVTSTHISTKKGFIPRQTLQCIQYVMKKMVFAPGTAPVEIEQSLKFHPKI